MEISVNIDLKFNARKQAEAVYKSLLPDNVALPDSLSLDMRISDRVISVMLHSSSKPDTLISTADDVLKSCQLALQSIDAMGG
ncbi:MAG: KEOPS complex subunit Pcc1 [Conexivisphaerales archaeon]